MADKTEIEWTDATWNPITGCSVVSPGCKHCYAMRLAGGRIRNHPSRRGLTAQSNAGPVWNGKVRFNEQWLTAPLRWRRPRRIFVCAHGDLFHESVPVQWIDLVHAVTILAPQHIFQVLTKRAGRMLQYYSDPDLQYHLKLAVEDLKKKYPGDAGRLPHIHDGEISIDRAGYIHSPWHAIPRSNIWLGVSVEDLERERRIDRLLETPAALRFVSFEPLLQTASPRNVHFDLSGLDWAIVGGESGPGARPMDPDRARSIRDSCRKQEVAFFFKQWGGPGPKSAGRLLDGILHDAIPERQDDDSWLIPLQGGGPGPAFRIRHPGCDDALTSWFWYPGPDPARESPDGRPPRPQDFAMMFDSLNCAWKRAARVALYPNDEIEFSKDVRSEQHYLVWHRGIPGRPEERRAEMTFRLDGRTLSLSETKPGASEGPRPERVLCVDGRWRQRRRVRLPGGQPA